MREEDKRGLAGLDNLGVILVSMFDDDIDYLGQDIRQMILSKIKGFKQKSLQDKSIAKRFLADGSLKK